ncbi:hypothetical protein MACH16_04930 [Marinomonas pontica]|uniref:Uncharacterized protein n=1 Tax=Marinomonas pontica TaxID=264739 RepID=A0ABM8FC27_9GAMM|nr:hypothetical protein MACH16_04930 [Marinomonas pontica]
MLDFQIEQINKYYKQHKNNKNGDILIYFGKKNVEARPYNYNLKLSQNRDLIRFGPSTPNHHDLSLSIGIALQNGWQSATLTNSSPEFLKKMMKAAYTKDPKLLFFVKPETPHALSLIDLKEIKDNLTVDDLKTALKNRLIKEKDIKMVHLELITKLTSNSDNISDQGYALALENGFNIEVLDTKTPEELIFYGIHQTFIHQPTDTTQRSRSSLESSSEEKNKVLLDIQEQLANDTHLQKQNRPNRAIDSKLRPS